MSFTILGCKESCFESAASAVVFRLTWLYYFILLIELEQDIKINIRMRDSEIF
jgi:hypothetical protein